MTPIPPNSSKFPPNAGSTQQGYFQVSNRDETTQAMNVRGPYYCRRIPVGGTLQLPKAGTSQMVVVDERIYFPLESGVNARSVLTEVRTGRKFIVAHTARWPDEIEVYAVRSSPT